MKRTENTKDIVGSVTYIDNTELINLISERDKYKAALMEIMDDFNNDIYSHEMVADIIMEALR